MFCINLFHCLRSTKFQGFVFYRVNRYILTNSSRSFYCDIYRAANKRKVLKHHFTLYVFSMSASSVSHDSRDYVPRKVVMKKRHMVMKTYANKVKINRSNFESFSKNLKGSRKLRLIIIWIVKELRSMKCRLNVYCMEFLISQCPVVLLSWIRMPIFRWNLSKK